MTRLGSSDFQPPTQDELKHQRLLVEQGERLAAALKARDVLYGMEYEADDILIVADWLMTGHADVALAISQQNARNYSDHRGSDDLSTDAASWTKLDAEL